MARCYFELGDYNTSIKEYESCLEKAGNSSLESYSLLGIAQSHEKLTKEAEAIKICDEIIEKYPDSDAVPEAYYIKTRLFFKAARYKDAEEIAREAIGKFPSSGYLDDLHYELGWIYTKQDRFREAVAEFAWVEKNSKDMTLSANSLCRIGDIRFDNREYDKAVESYDIVLDKYSDTPLADYAQYQIGNIFMLQERCDQAILA
ncbi:MAG: tetratricopeptide repeat protein [Candidatus Omnitrophica bacterium]|nr:tetratricopeptide repeat protein [Candidatus Omnitrophota bacterium]